MTPADWLILAVVVLNVIAAAMQGFFAEALSMAGLIVGYIVAAWQYQRVADWLGSVLTTQWLADMLAFLAIFFAVVLAFALAGRIARWVMKQAGLSGFDRFLGGVLGLLKGGLMVAVILMGMTAFTPTSRMLERSELAPYFLIVGRHLAGAFSFADSVLSGPGPAASRATESGCGPAEVDAVQKLLQRERDAS
jgi:membrane protein required for colicin V production